MQVIYYDVGEVQSMTLAKDPFPEMQTGISTRPLVVFTDFVRRCFLPRSHAVPMAAQALAPTARKWCGRSPLRVRSFAESIVRMIRLQLKTGS